MAPPSQAKSERPFSEKLSRSERPRSAHRAHIFLLLCPLALLSKPEELLVTLVKCPQRDAPVERATLRHVGPALSPTSLLLPQLLLHTLRAKSCLPQTGFWISVVQLQVGVGGTGRGHA